MQRRCKDLYGFIADLSYMSVLDIENIEKEEED